MARTALALAAPLLLLLAAQAARAANFETSIEDAELVVTSPWATGFCGQLVTKNPGSNPTSGWAGLFTFQGGKLTSEPQGNGVAEKISASQWTFKPTDPAQAIIEGGSPVSVAFCCEDCSPKTSRVGFRVIFSYDWRGKGEAAAPAPAPAADEEEAVASAPAPAAEEEAAPAPAPAADEEEAVASAPAPAAEEEEAAPAPAPATVEEEEAAPAPAPAAVAGGRKAGPKQPAATVAAPAPAPARSAVDQAKLDAAADILSSIPPKRGGGKKPRGVKKPAAADASAAAPSPAADTDALLAAELGASAGELIDGAAEAPAPALAAAADIVASIPIPGSEAAPLPKAPGGKRAGADVGAEWWVSDREARAAAQELEAAGDAWWRYF